VATLETKARFINQVMNGSVTVRQAEDLEGGALTYAEIKAIASGNPAVMEKVKVDTEIRKLDQLRASHINQQHNIRWQIKSLPEHIESGKKYHAAAHGELSTERDVPDQYCGHPELLTISDVAEWLGVSKGWVYDHTTRKQARLPAIRFGEVTRFRRQDIEKFIQEHARRASGSA